MRLATFALACSIAVVGLSSDAWAARARKPAPAPPPAPPVEVVLPASPPLFSAKFVVEADGFQVGEMHRTLSALGNDTYALETKVETTGLVSVFKPDKYKERSTLKSTPNGYLPIEFSSRYTGRFKEVVESLQFDWDQSVVHSLRNGKEKTVSVEPGVLDKLMYQVVMQNELSRGLTQFRYRVVDRGKIEKYEMHVIGEETIDTALGKQRTVKVQKGTTIIWCAVDLDYLPVLLEQREDGHVITTHLTSLSIKERASLARVVTAPSAP